VTTPRIFWLSFCDRDRPTGEQFRGAVVIEVTPDEAEAARAMVRERYPMAASESAWLAAAIRKAHHLQCNPGGEVAAHEIPSDHPERGRFPVGVLLDRATIARLDEGHG
jgi:hypothetical protein